MNDPEFAQLMALLDSLWGQNDPVYEAGFSFLLKDEPYDLVEATVRAVAQDGAGEHRDQRWMPKPPELYARVMAEKRRIERGDRFGRRLIELRRAAARDLVTSVGDAEGGDGE